MSKNLLLKLFYVSCLFAFLASCDDDGYHESDRLTANYSNKLADGEAANLSLSYSGAELIGKSVYFKTSDTKTADITLLDILPGERETSITNIALTPVGGGYAFGGNATATSGIRFEYSGKVEEGKLTVEIKNAQLPSNFITTQNKWYTLPYTGEQSTETDPETGISYTNVTYGAHFHSDDTDVSSVASLVEAIGGNILGSVLRNVNFLPDGNITARYGSMPQVDNFMGYLMPLPIRPESDYTESPLNLITYYVKDNAVYITPNIDMIIRLIQTNQSASATRATEVSDYLEIYKLLNRWATTGICLHINDDIQVEELFTDYYIKHQGDMILYMDKHEVEPLFPLLPLLPGLIPDDNNMKGMLVQILESITSGLANARIFELGLVFQKEYSVEIPAHSAVPAGAPAQNSELYQRNVKQLNKIAKK